MEEREVRFEQLIRASLARQQARWAKSTRLFPVLAVLGCLACPAHLAGLAALFGLGWHSATDHHAEPLWVVLLLVAGLYVPLVEFVFHRRHRCRHDH